MAERHHRQLFLDASGSRGRHLLLVETECLETLSKDLGMISPRFWALE